MVLNPTLYRIPSEPNKRSDIVPEGLGTDLLEVFCDVGSEGAGQGRERGRLLEGEHEVVVLTTGAEMGESEER